MRNTFILFLLLSIVVLSSCGDDVTPKPRGYFRIAIPEHQFVKLDSNKYPFTFEYADYSKLNNANDPDHPYWCYIDYPSFKARIYITYRNVNGNINQMLEDAHELAYKHISVANDIKQDLIIKPQNKVYGLVYEIKGAKVASPLNFFLTDSIEHFVRGSLYFNMKPQNDSLEPVIEGISDDLKHIINTFKWNNINAVKQ
jgi:gliding motility-associated lipoprotein GldD